LDEWVEAGMPAELIVRRLRVIKAQQGNSGGDALKALHGGVEFVVCTSVLPDLGVRVRAEVSGEHVVWGSQ
jgi:hypothetical protein